MNCKSCGVELTDSLAAWGDPGEELCWTCYGETALSDDKPEYGYGFFPGGDPRDFTPDYELCTPAEIEAWKADCAAWERGEGQPCPPPCFHSEDRSLHVLAPRYGLGVYRVWNE